MTDCTFCDIVTSAPKNLNGAGSPGAHYVYADAEIVAFLDFKPVFKGHVLVSPRKHYVTLADLPPEEIRPLFSVVRGVSAAVPAALGAQGTFVAMNNIVSQSVPHLHVHVVPRTKGDGLRGFFWPRTRYDSDPEAADYAARISSQISTQLS
ncbi:MAG TPA: HIT family protein [Streptosporangiaceae bacterium]